MRFDRRQGMAELNKMIVVAVDGSENALKSLDYLSLIYGSKHNLEVVLLHVLPTLPQILVADDDRQSKLRLLAVEKKSVQMAERILSEAKHLLRKKGFKEEHIRSLHRKKQMGIARDICNLAADKRADSVLISAKGRSKLEAFFSGGVANRMCEYCRVCPVWIMEGTVRSRTVLIAIDSSENALRSVDHAAFMLSGTDCQLTLFHSKRHLRRFVPQELIDAAPELEELWENKAGEQIAPYMKRAKEMLLEAGIPEAQIKTKVVDGSRDAASDILKEAKSNDFGTIVLGRRGHSGVKEFFMGSVTSKVLQDCAGMAVWLVQ
jgi:nucleotide-binding universal stress UspA family protein